MQQNMAGGDLTTKYPARMVMSMLFKHIDTDDLVGSHENRLHRILQTWQQ